MATRLVYELPREWHWLAKVAVPFLLLRRARERLAAVCATALLAGAAVVAEGGVFVLTRYVG